MHKHGSKGRRQSDRPAFKNANGSIDNVSAATIRGIADSLEGDGGFALEHLRKEFLSKFCSENLVSAADRRSAAIIKWKQTESLNADTNRRLRGLHRDYNLLPRVRFYTFLKFAQRLIKDILGPLSDEVVLGSFSGGASTSRSRLRSNPALKYTGMADATKGAMQYIDVLHRQAPLLREKGVFYSVREVEGAVLFTVPKKTDIDRCACKEPDVNMYLQKGVGAHIRSRLLRDGINLNDQSVNRGLARIGSLDGSLSTLDLSSASDTITVSCVLALLPLEWFLYLNDIRSQSVVVDGTVVRTEMFSSMGNGFTFELESLIFYALMRTCAYFGGYRGTISVYGDDLIIPSGMYDDACWVLKEFGFSVNLQKSFATGPFRESCGGHYYNGEDVTPFYLKREVTHLTDVIRVANQLRHWCLVDPARQFLVHNSFEIWSSIASMVPKGLWGGSDSEVDTQLVSPGTPVSRLCRVTGSERLDQLGLYLHWQNSNWNRRNPPDKLRREPVRTTLRCRLRPAKPGARLTESLFLKEY